MVGHEGSSADEYFADPASPISFHCNYVIIMFKSVPVHQFLWLALKELTHSKTSLNNILFFILLFILETKTYLISWFHIWLSMTDRENCSVYFFQIADQQPMGCSEKVKRILSREYISLQNKLTGE